MNALTKHVIQHRFATVLTRLTGTDANAEELTKRFLDSIDPGLSYYPHDDEITEFIEKPYRESGTLDEWRAANAQAVVKP
jgi:selenocysteine-specific translation elongation factor